MSGIDDIAEGASKIITAGLDGAKFVSGAISKVVQTNLVDETQTRQHHQKSKPGVEGSLCGTVGTRCTPGLVCSPVPKAKNTQTAAFNNGMCVDYTKARLFDETCDSTGVLHCDPRWACLDAEKYNFGKLVHRAFHGQTKKLRRCTYCTDDHDCIGDRWCGTTNGGAKKICQTGVRPALRVLARCVDQFVYEHKKYDNTCVTNHLLWGLDLKFHSWCPTVVNESLEYTDKEGAATEWKAERTNWKNILLCTPQNEYPCAGESHR